MRTDSGAIRELVQGFASSNVSSIWFFVDDTIRSALIDQLIMQHITLADAVGSQKPITPAELLEFRTRLVAALARGARRNGLQRFMLDADREKAGGDTELCKACIARRDAGFEGQCPACAHERARKGNPHEDPST